MYHKGKQDETTEGRFLIAGFIALDHYLLFLKGISPPLQFFLAGVSLVIFLKSVFDIRLSRKKRSA
ncbi:hypothetical protein AAW28_00950 [Lacticaseibacillus casei]|nr:hypothetical protein AAW28_00950 [Lacticaseibacillus casei]